MTVLASIPSQQYAPQTLSQTINVPQRAMRMLVTLTREAWPEGPVGSISIYYPDGTLATASSFNGGVTVIYGRTITKQEMPVYGKTLDGVVQDLPKGSFRFDIEILQTLTTSVLIERF